MHEHILDIYKRNPFDRFLPPGVASGHDLLYGSGQNAQFVPKPQTLTEFLHEYSDFLAAQAEESVSNLLSFELMDLSELLIAYLQRSQASGIALPADGIAERLHALLVRLTPPLQALVKQLHGGGNDALKRMQTLITLLE